MSHRSEIDREDAFRALYGAAYPDLLRFVQRRTGSERAEDVVAEDVVAEDDGADEAAIVAEDS